MLTSLLISSTESMHTIQDFCVSPIKKIMRLSLFLSYTASIFSVPGGRPNQKFWILAGLRDTKDPSRLVLQKCAPFFFFLETSVMSELFFKPCELILLRFLSGKQ